ncbi:MAG: hypothetical protein ABF876_08405 [Acetobacter aceti]|nr:hypothetical protein [Acetobacter aceti]
MKNAWLVRVKPSEKARFYENGYRSGCPALKPACRKKAYLVPGDIAVAAYRMGAFTVIDFVGKNGDPTDGAVETRLLEDIPMSEPVTQDWVGKWKDTDEQVIRIDRTRVPSVLAFQGDATWGAGDPERVKNGGVHTGSFAAYVKPVETWGGFLTEARKWDSFPERTSPTVSDQKGLDTDWSRVFPPSLSDVSPLTDHTECSGAFRLLGPYLLVSTPVDICGGLNVSFIGVYRKVAR